MVGEREGLGSHGEGLGSHEEQLKQKMHFIRVYSEPGHLTIFYLHILHKPLLQSS